MGIQVLKPHLRRSLQNISEINAETTKERRNFGQEIPYQTFKE